MTDRLNDLINETTTPAQLLEFEAAAGHGEKFTDLDRLLGELLIGSFRRQGVVAVEPRPGPNGDNRVVFGHLSDHAAAALDDRFALARLEGNGAWYAPERIRIPYGFANLPQLSSAQPRFCVNLAREQVAGAMLRDDPAAVALWSVVGPMFDELFAPIDVRTATTKAKTEKAARAEWAEIVATFDELGLDGGPPLAAMAYGAGWASRPLDEMVALRSQLIDSLSLQVSADTARLWRARATLRLVRAFQKKAKRGTPLAKSVLTKQHQPALAGLFAGSWVDFVSYLGLAPNDAEQVTTALPEPRLFVGGENRSNDVAASTGLEVDQVQRILASYLGQDPAAESPVAERVRWMRAWWDYFDQAHSSQRPGMPSLWGLVDDGYFSVHDDNPRMPITGAYRRHVPAEICDAIDRLWDGITNAKWPDKILSEFHPHHQMADAFGPALSLWNGVALTCWFVCEGPSSRTDLQGLEHYHRKHLFELTEMGFPIDPALFADLRDAERRLGPEQPLTTESSAGGVTFQLSYGSRRDGFEILRDIVTRHRRQWAATHLDAYLTARWDSELRTVATEYSRRVAARGKPPTLKQFASVGAAAANHWFDGDLARLYAALGEKSQASPERIDFLAGDPVAFGRAVYAALGGGPPLDEDTSMRDPEARNRQWALERFAKAAFDYVHTAERLGRVPTFDEFDGTKFEWDLIGGPGQGWQRFHQAVETARTAGVPAARSAVVPVQPAAAPPAPAAGWFPDPSGRHEHRYWDGRAWTEHVASGGQQRSDPVT